MTIYTRLEIDVMQANELREASEITTKYRFPGLVVHPGLTSEAIILRGKLGGKYKIITPVDWPKGETFGMTKMRGLSTDSLDVDGFEILLTPGKTRLETRNEAMAITQFIHNHLGKLVEIRYVLGLHVHPLDTIQTLCDGLKTVATPAMIRTDTHLKVQVSKANSTTNNESIAMINGIIKAPIKVSGNINDVRTMMACREASKFAVSLLQAKTIIKEFSQQPTQLRELLD